MLKSFGWQKNIIRIIIRNLRQTTTGIERAPAETISLKELGQRLNSRITHLRVEPAKIKGAQKWQEKKR